MMQLNRTALKLILMETRTLCGDGGAAQSTRKVDPQASGWTKRMRVGNQLTNKQTAMDSVRADQVESGDTISAHSTDRMDPQVPGWTRRVGKHRPDRKPCPSGEIELAPWSRQFTGRIWYKIRKKQAQC